MTTEDQTTEKRDEDLWRLAKKRAGFKSSLTSYVLVNALLWAIWYFTNDDHRIGRHNIPWPAWSTVFWGFGVAWQYVEAYIFPKSNATEREYQKLKNSRQ